MSTFVRTTGGLLQLKPNRLSDSDFVGLVDFAIECGLEPPHAVVSSSNTAAAGEPPFLTPLSISRKEPIDLLAQEPAIFK